MFRTTFVGATMAVVTLLWIRASSEMIIADTRAFIVDMMRQDARWAPYLNVNVKVDTGVLTVAARNVLASVAKAGGTVQTGEDAAAADGTVTVNVLHAIGEVVSAHAEEGDAFAFGMSLIASAVKCTVLKDVWLQLRVLGAQLPDSLHAYPAWMSDVRTNLTGYIDKLARLKEPLAVETRIYRAWTDALWESTPLRSGDHVRPASVAVGDVAPTRNLVYESLTSACELCAEDAENWTTHDDVSRIMADSQARLDEIFRELPIRSMHIAQWMDVFNTKEITERTVDHHVKLERMHAENAAASQEL